MYNLLPHSKPAQCFLFWWQMQRYKNKGILSLVNKIRGHCTVYMYIQRAHTAVCSAVQEGTNARPQYHSGVFSSWKLWFLWLLINPYPVYLQAKDFSYQNRVVSHFEWFDMPLHYIYTKLIIIWQIIALQLCSFFMGLSSAWAALVHMSNVIKSSLFFPANLLYISQLLWRWLYLYFYKSPDM